MSEVPFSRICPNLKFVDFSALVWKGYNYVAMPSVKHVSIRATKSKKSMGLNYEEKEIRDLLKMNPQIEDLTLNITGEFNDVIFQGSIENLPMLKRFSLDMSTKNIVQRYHLDGVIDFDMNIRENHLPEVRPEDNWLNIPFTFSKLERFECNHLFSRLLDFIAENRHLKSISIKDYSNRIDELFHVVSGLTNIEELSFEWPSNLASELILSLFSQSPSLKKLILRVNQDDFQNLNDSVKSKIVKQEEWHNFRNMFKLTLHP